MTEVAKPKVTFIPAPPKDEVHIFEKQFEGLDEIVVMETSKYIKDVLRDTTEEGNE